MAQIRLSGDLKTLAEKLSGQGGRLRPVMAAGAASARLAIVEYYRSISQHGFYASQANSEKVAITALGETRAEITIDSYELVHKIKGGDVYPLPPRHNISVPLTDEARAAGYPSNRRIKGVFRPGHIKGVPNSGKHVLAVKDGKGFRVLWALAEKVTHRPDPKAEIPAELLEAAAEGVMRSELLNALKE